MGSSNYQIAEALEFSDIDMFEPVSSAKREVLSTSRSTAIACDGDWKPRRLSNGKWACNHKCRDKTTYASLTVENVNAN